MRAKASDTVRRAAIYAGVFVIGAVFLVGLLFVSVRYNRVASSPGTAACFKTTCY